MNTSNERKKIKEVRPKYYVDKAGKYRWRLIAKNGEIFGASHQGFSTKQKARANFSLQNVRVLKEI